LFSADFAYGQQLLMGLSQLSLDFTDMEKAEIKHITDYLKDLKGLFR
jgi:hypothetical protein